VNRREALTAFGVLVPSGEWLRNGTDVSRHWMRLRMPNGDTWTFPIERVSSADARHSVVPVQVTGTVIYRPFWG